MISSQEILQKTGISYHTLFKYVSFGLVPMPRRLWMGGGGSESWYSDDVVDIIKRIKEEQAKGLPLRKIAEKWQAEKARTLVEKLATRFHDFDIQNGKVLSVKTEAGDSVIVEIELPRKRG